jgi:hypothetical protein
VYIDDIIVYSFPGENYKERVREVLERLRKVLLFVKLSKYKFLIDIVDFLSYYIGVEGVSIDIRRISII